MAAQKLHTKEESNDVEISILPTPNNNKQRQQTSLRLYPSKVLQYLCLYPSTLKFTFHIPPPTRTDGRSEERRQF